MRTRSPDCPEMPLGIGRDPLRDRGEPRRRFIAVTPAEQVNGRTRTDELKKF